ncbi:MAG: Asp23/Gls24 family envelope stress response protein [Clostridiales Family XIII bacterium]|nr:Asp23/Gls24 family envelope stress response protein [Clostridiales Family XIII bacterium]
MLYTEKAELGSVKFDTRVLGNITKHAIEGLNGKMIVSGPKGRLSRGAEKPNSDDLTFLKASLTEHAVDMTVYVVVRFGAGIKNTAAALAEAIRSDVPMITGLSVNRLSIIITGIRSKNFSKRNIVVTTYAK